MGAQKTLFPKLPFSTNSVVSSGDGMEELGYDLLK